MGLKEFDEEDGPDFRVDKTEEKVRPYVSHTSHELVRKFSKHAGIDISTAYDVIIQNTLETDEIIKLVLEESSSDGNVYKKHHENLLEDLADKIDELGRLPTRDEINDDDGMFGFPIYIDAFGSLDRVEELLKEHKPETYSKINKDGK